MSCHSPNTGSILGRCLPSRPCLASPEPSRSADRPIGSGFGNVPTRVHHGNLGLVWMVEEVLWHWQRAGKRYSLPGSVLTERWRLHVNGHMPGEPGERGKFVMEVRTYGDRPGWWITPWWGFPEQRRNFR